MPEHYSQFGEAAGAAMAHNARTAARHTVERAAEEQPVHACPPVGSGLTPCCGRTPFELPRGDRMTSEPEQVTCMTSPKGASKPTHACAPGCPGCNAPGGVGECGPEDRPAPAPRDALGAPQTAEPPVPGPERHPGGENGPHTGTQDRAELCRRFKDAITRRWDVAPFVIDEIVDDAVDCHLGLAARATADLRAQLAEQAAIDTQVMEKADRECDEHIAAGRAFRQLAERTQAWGEQHRDRANRYRARVDRALRRLDAWEQQLPETVLTATVLEVLRGDLAPQAGDDTTGATP